MEPGDKQGGADAGVVKGYFYAHRSPSGDQLGPEGALAIARGCLNDDDLMVCAALRETWPRDVVRREAAHLRTLHVAPRARSAVNGWHLT
jgi:hypothetical protein